MYLGYQEKSCTRPFSFVGIILWSAMIFDGYNCITSWVENQIFLLIQNIPLECLPIHLPDQPLQEGEELVMDEQAYLVYHQVREVIHSKAYLVLLKQNL